MNEWHYKFLNTPYTLLPLVSSRHVQMLTICLLSFRPHVSSQLSYIVDIVVADLAYFVLSQAKATCALNCVFRGLASSGKNSLVLFHGPSYTLVILLCWVSAPFTPTS